MAKCIFYSPSFGQILVKISLFFGCRCGKWVRLHQRWGELKGRVPNKQKNKNKNKLKNRIRHHFPCQAGLLKYSGVFAAPSRADVYIGKSVVNLEYNAFRRCNARYHPW